MKVKGEEVSPHPSTEGKGEGEEERIGKAMNFIVIGITDNPNPRFSPEVLEIIKSGKVFSGGKRHHDIMASLLPTDALWIDITVPLEDVFEQYRGLSEKTAEHTLIVFASGDPLFFGFANTLRREFPEATLQVFPTFNSLQMLAHKLVIPYHDMRIVSLTGRPWHEFDKALIERTTKIGVLTDKNHTPAAIAQRMLEYGYDEYRMHVGTHLGHPELEQTVTLSLEEAKESVFPMPNCVILDGKTAERTSPIPGNITAEQAKPFGIPDAEFSLLNGREKMITKMPIRLLTLQALELPKHRVFWDIGFCTGSVSIEAKLQFPHLQIDAFEIRPECEHIIHENARRFGVPGIEVHIGDFMDCCDNIATDRMPDAVFIGGHGGKLKEIMAKVMTILAPDGVVVMNSVIAPKVTTDSRQLWDEACQELGLRQDPPTRIQLNDNHTITILRCRK